MDPGHSISMLLGWAVVLPLCSFFVILVFGPRMGKAGEHAASLATAAIGMAAILSFISLAIWLSSHRPGTGEAHASVASPSSQVVVRGQEPEAEKHAGANAHQEKHAAPALTEHESSATEGGEHATAKPHYTNDYSAPGIGGPWVLGEFGKLRVSISYYIDSLTVCMFCMVTFIATLIHIYAMGYMHDELHDITDHEVTLSDGEHLHRPGRYPRFLPVPVPVLL